jgi:UDP:flavonoid glycosyltransferase YjiC (YdhE family)
VAAILIHTFGSLGDLHPYLALARGLNARGHRAVIATSAGYRAHVERAGVAFHPVRPDLDDFGPFAEVARKVYDPRRGAEHIVRSLVMPRLVDTVDDLLDVAAHADLILTHPLSFAAQLIARSLQRQWMSTVLSPMVFLSVHDPPPLPPAPWLRTLFEISPALYRTVFGASRRLMHAWTQPVRDLARARGWPPPAEDPLFEGQYSPLGTLAMFSPLLAQPQPDWPQRTSVTGFAIHDEAPSSDELRERLAAFLAAGPPPIVFTLGSSAIYDARDFYRVSLEIARRLGRRALLLTGAVPDNVVSPAPPEDVLAIDYAPHALVFPHAAAIVHQGGIGTLAQAMRAGRPMLIVPFSHDQPDNARRAAALGIARAVPRSRFDMRSGCEALHALLALPQYEQAARRVQAQVLGEDGVCAACARIEQVLDRPNSSAASSLT